MTPLYVQQKIHGWLRVALRCRHAFFCGLLVLAALPSQRLAAQGFISVGAGVGGGFGDRNRNSSGSGTHGTAYVQLHPPLIPFALRGDALLSRVGNNDLASSLSVNAVVLAPLPVVVPYALLGYGHYGIGRSGSQSGWNAGVGARVRLPNIALFAEVRRHQRISRDLFTIGISR